MRECRIENIEFSKELYSTNKVWCGRFVDLDTKKREEISLVVFPKNEEAWNAIKNIQFRQIVRGLVIPQESSYKSKTGEYRTSIQYIVQELIVSDVPAPLPEFGEMSSRPNTIVADGNDDDAPW